LLCFVLSCPATNLYSIVTEFSYNDQETMVYTVLIDRQTGVVTNVTADLMYAGGSATIDGISAFDQRGGRYFWASDSATAEIYSSNVIRKQFLPPLYIGADAIEGLVYNNINNRLYTLYAMKSGIILAEIGPQSFRGILGIPPQYNAGYVMKGAVDGKTNTYYLAAKIGTSTAPTYAIVTINILNGQITRSVPIDNSTCTLFPEYLWYDETSKLLLGGGESFVGNSLLYYFLKINPVTGQCSKTQLSTPVGIVTDWSYDSSTEELWFSEATNSGAFLISYNINTGQQTTPVLVQHGLVPESIEISIFH